MPDAQMQQMRDILMQFTEQQNQRGDFRSGPTKGNALWFNDEAMAKGHGNWSGEIHKTPNAVNPIFRNAGMKLMGPTGNIRKNFPPNQGEAYLQQPGLIEAIYGQQFEPMFSKKLY